MSLPPEVASPRPFVPAPRDPSLLDVLAPVVVLIALTIVLFGTAAADGPLQVLSATFAAIVAYKNATSCSQCAG